MSARACAVIIENNRKAKLFRYRKVNEEKIDASSEVGKMNK